jgi:AAA domain-containing protein/DNA primase RepB-like protein
MIMRPSDFIADFFSATEGSIYFCSLPNERCTGTPAEVCGRGGGARLDELVSRWDRNDRGTFFCVNTLKPRQSRRSKETVHEITCLFADLDFSKIDLEPDAILARLNSLPCLPSKVINSGHGLHAYWILNEALPATPENVAHTEGLLRLLSVAVGGDPAVCEVARLMRLPGSCNTKNGDRLPVTVAVNRPLRYEISDLEEWLAAQRPIVPHKGAVRPDNPFLAVDVNGGGVAVDVDARLAAMRYQGAGDTSIHQTQLAVSAALLNRGHSVDDTVDTILQATRAAAGTHGARWNWGSEARDIRAMCASWNKKKLNGQRSATPSPSSVGMEELSAMEFKPVNFLVPDLIPAEGVTLICSKPKVGKSWFLYDLCISTAIDRDVLGDRRPLQGHALYLALEDSLRRLQRRGEKMLPAWLGPWPQNVRVAVEWPRVDQGGLDRIREWVVTTRSAGATCACIAIDVLKMIRPAGQDRKAAYDRDYEALVGLRSLAHELGVAIVVAHHTRKLASDDLLDLVSGTLGLSGSADTIIVIERQGGGFVFDVRGRDVEAAQLAATFDKESCRWAIAGDAAMVRRSAEREAVLSAFRDAKEPLTVELLTAALREADSNSAVTVSKSRNAVHQILSRMVRNGDLRRLKRGFYELPTHMQSVSQ